MVENCGRLLNTVHGNCVDTYISTPLLTTALSKLVHAPQCFTQCFEQASNWSPCFRFAHWNLYTAGKGILFKFKSHNVTVLHCISVSSTEAFAIQQLLCVCSPHCCSCCISHRPYCLLLSALTAPASCAVLEQARQPAHTGVFNLLFLIQILFLQLHASLAPWLPSDLCLNNFSSVKFSLAIPVGICPFLWKWGFFFHSFIYLGIWLLTVLKKLGIK